eukprot:11207674-Lingulodinium_polyedra.AAC.1
MPWPLRRQRHGRPQICGYSPVFRASGARVCFSALGLSRGEARSSSYRRPGCATRRHGARSSSRS